MNIDDDGRLHRINFVEINNAHFALFYQEQHGNMFVYGACRLVPKWRSVLYGTVCILCVPGIEPSSMVLYHKRALLVSAQWCGYTNFFGETVF